MMVFYNVKNVPKKKKQTKMRFPINTVFNIYIYYISFGAIIDEVRRESEIV